MSTVNLDQPRSKTFLPNQAVLETNIHNRRLCSFFARFFRVRSQSGHVLLPLGFFIAKCICYLLPSTFQMNFQTTSKTMTLRAKTRVNHGGSDSGPSHFHKLLILASPRVIPEPLVADLQDRLSKQNSGNPKWSICCLWIKKLMLPQLPTEHNHLDVKYSHVVPEGSGFNPAEADVIVLAPEIMRNRILLGNARFGSNWFGVCTNAFVSSLITIQREWASSSISDAAKRSLTLIIFPLMNDVELIEQRVREQLDSQDIETSALVESEQPPAKKRKKSSHDAKSSSPPPTKETNKVRKADKHILFVEAVVHLVHQITDGKANESGLRSFTQEWASREFKSFSEKRKEQGLNHYTEWPKADIQKGLSIAIKVAQEMQFSPSDIKTRLQQHADACKLNITVIDLHDAVKNEWVRRGFPKVTANAVDIIANAVLGNFEMRS